MTIVNNDIN
jgi:hypothetical protein